MSNIRSVFVAILIGFVLLSGCLQQPRIITDSMSLNVTATNASAFIEAGCIMDRIWGNNGLDCSSIGLEERFSCEHIEILYDLGGLSPNVPIVECTFIAKNWTGGADEGIVREGCLRPEFRKYIIIEDGEYKLIGSKEEFVRFFAPVESPEEALGFAVALTGAYTDYNMTIPEGYKVFASEIKTTYVEESDGGFRVHLFDMQSCGCGNHPYYAVDYIVTRTGDVNETSSERIYENPQFAGLCVD